jgi:hypothetical protein
MTHDHDDDHDHDDQDRPGIAEQRAVLRTYRAVLRGAAPEAARQAAGDGACCAECAIVVAAAFGITLAEQLAAELVRKLAPGAELDAGPIRAAILDVIDRAEREIDTGLN